MQKYAKSKNAKKYKNAKICKFQKYTNAKTYKIMQKRTKSFKQVQIRKIDRIFPHFLICAFLFVYLFWCLFVVAFGDSALGKLG